MTEMHESIALGDTAEVEPDRSRLRSRGFHALVERAAADTDIEVEPRLGVDE